jgi:hypothetical protein
MADGVKTRQIQEKLNLMILSPMSKIKAVTMARTVTRMSTILGLFRSYRLLPQNLDPLPLPRRSALLLNRAENIDNCIRIVLEAFGAWSLVLGQNVPLQQH